MNILSQSISHHDLAPQNRDLQRFLVDISNFTKLGELGKGKSGVVWKSQQKSNLWIVAIKELSQVTDTKLSKAREDDFFKEVRILAKFCDNPFLIEFVGFSVQNPYAIVTTYMPSGSLWDVIHSNMNQSHNGKSNNVLNDTQKTNIALGIAHGMRHLHDHNIIHLDLKSPNILLDEMILPKITDFGISKFSSPWERSIEERCAASDAVDQVPNNLENGTLKWMSPEAIKGQECGRPADVYSFGIILYELYTGLIPYQGINDIMLCHKVVNENERPVLPETNSPLSQLIIRCWKADPSQRPTFAAIYHLFASGEVSFPRCQRKGVVELLKIINQKDAYSQQLRRSTADNLNTTIELRNNYMNMPNNLTEEQKNANQMYIQSCLTRFAAEGNADLITTYISSLPFIDLNAFDANRMTPLHSAVIHDQLVVVQQFVRLSRIFHSNQKRFQQSHHSSHNAAQTIDLNKRDDNGNTAFLLSVIYNRPRIAAYLGQIKEVDVNAQNKYGQSVLHLMVQLNPQDRSFMLSALSYAINLNLNLVDIKGRKAFDGNEQLMRDYLDICNVNLQ